MTEYEYQTLGLGNISCFSQVVQLLVLCAPI